MPVRRRDPVRRIFGSRGGKRGAEVGFGFSQVGAKTAGFTMLMSGNYRFRVLTQQGFDPLIGQGLPTIGGGIGSGHAGLQSISG